MEWKLITVLFLSGLIKKGGVKFAYPTALSFAKEV